MLVTVDADRMHLQPCSLLGNHLGDSFLHPLGQASDGLEWFLSLRNRFRAFLDAVRWWPERATVRPNYRGLSVLQIIEAGKREQAPAPSAHSPNKHQSRLGLFFNGLVNLDLPAKNPLKPIQPEIDTSTDLDTGRAFTTAELQAKFESARFKAWATIPHRWWGPMIGLYTGARVSEVA